MQSEVESVHRSAMAVAGVWVALAAIVVALVFNLFRRRRPKLNLPPGPPGMPVLGNLLVLRGPKLPHQALADLSKRYGPLTFLRLGSTPCIVASSPQACREIFKNEDRLFCSRPWGSMVEHVMYQGKGLIMSPFGNHWRQMRKVATLELLTSKRIDEFEGARVAEASAMVRSIHHYETGKSVNLHLLLMALTFNFTTHCCFHKRFFHYGLPTDNDEAAESNEEKAMAREFGNLFDELSILFGLTPIGDLVPYLSFIDRFTGIKARAIKLHRQFDDFLRRIIEEHKEHPKQADAKLDFVDALLRLPGEDGAEHLNEVIIRAFCLDILAAGTHTSSTALEWIMTEVLRHPEIAEKLKAELDAVVGKERLVTEADIPNLPYVQAVVKEGLRLHPVLPLLVPHESLEQTKVMGYDIPKGTTVLTNVWAMHRDPTIWNNPMEFRPERFLEDNPEIDVKGQHYQLLPFGAGRRGCPGLGLGLIMVQYTLARILQAFDWSLPIGMKPEDVNIEESFGSSLSKAHALEAVATARLPFSLY